MSLEDDHLIGKRKKKKDPCPNPLFCQWITEWKDDAASKGIKSQYTYNKALQTLKKYPARVVSGKECKILENFGDKICNMLDQKLAEYVAQYGTTEPVDGYLTIPVGNKPKKRKATTNTGFDDLNFANLRVPPPPGAPPGGYNGDNADARPDGGPQQPVRQRRATGNRQPREYIPQYRSGPYAILLTLFRRTDTATRVGHMSKRDLIQEAQPLADKSFSIPDPGSRYTAWSSMGSLINKGLIVKESSPAKYRLTDAGLELAIRIHEGERQGEFNMPARSVNDELRFHIGAGPPLPADHGGIMAQDDSDSDDVIAVRYDQDVRGQGHQDIRGQGYQDIRGQGHSGNDHRDYNFDMKPPLPALDIEEPELDSASGFKFSYINEAGNEVSYKDQAVVTVDEEISVGFLIKCTYEDLLMSGKLYKLDTTRHTIDDSIYAYLTDSDAPDSCPKVTNKVPEHRKPTTAILTHNNNIKTINHIEQPSTSSASTSGRFPGTGYSLTCQSNNDVIDLDHRPTSIHDCKPKARKEKAVKPKPTSTLTAPANNVPKFPPVEENFLPDLPSDSSQSLPSISGDSQSQGSISDVGGASRSTIDDPEFIMRSGTFNVKLIVDNQEFYGGGDVKKQIVRELERHQVPHQIRPLNIGDFCWVATDNIGGHELVLDYIVERKRMDDLAGSIIDGRFREQKFRLKGCGLHHPIYLVEDYGSNQHFSIGEDALFQAVTNTQIIDGFYVKRTGDSKESAAYLTLMTRYLQSLHANKTLCAVSKSCLDSTDYNADDALKTQQIPLMKFEEFNQASVKTKAYTVREMFGKQLCQLQGLTADKAAAILTRYPTPTRLIKAYRGCGSLKEKETLLADIKFGATHKNIGAAMSKNVYYMYNTTGNS